MSLMHYLQESNDHIFITAICLFENFIDTFTQCTFLIPISSSLTPTLPHPSQLHSLSLLKEKPTQSSLGLWLPAQYEVNGKYCADDHICVFNSHALFWGQNAITKDFILHRYLHINVHQNFIHDI